MADILVQPVVGQVNVSVVGTDIVLAVAAAQGPPGPTGPQGPAGTLPADVALTDASNSFTVGEQTITAARHERGLVLIKSVVGGGAILSDIIVVMNPIGDTTASLDYLGNLTLAATITASNFLGNGSQLTNLTAANLVGTIPVGSLPAIAISDFLGAVASQAAMLALVGERGDWCTRTDTSETYILSGDDPTQLADWTKLLTPAGGSWGSITGTLSSQTDLNTALGLKAPLAGPTFTGNSTFQEILFDADGSRQLGGTNRPKICAYSFTSDQSVAPGGIFVWTNTRNDGNYWGVGSAGLFGFSSATNANSAPFDTTLIRAAAGIVVATDNGAGSDVAIGMAAKSSTTVGRDRFRITATAIDNTDATRKYRAALTAYDTVARETARVWADGSSGRMAVTVPASAPTDAHIGTSQVTFYLDEVGNKLKFRVLYSDGTTFKTGEVALT